MKLHDLHEARHHQHGKMKTSPVYRYVIDNNITHDLNDDVLDINFGVMKWEKWEEVDRSLSQIDGVSLDGDEDPWGAEDDYNTILRIRDPHQAHNPKILRLVYIHGVEDSWEY